MLGEALAWKLGEVVSEIETTVIRSIQEFSKAVSDLAAENTQYWYRGVRDAVKHRLVPSLYRHPIRKIGDDLHDLESEVIQNFNMRSPPFLSNAPKEEIEKLFLMQHHGVPTRLLDWSENPFVGLFFALENASLESSVDATDAAVWVLSPMSLNSFSLSQHANPGRIFLPHDDMLHAHLPRGKVRATGKWPVAIYGVHNSARIVAQRGVFTLCGVETKPLEEIQLVENSKFLRKYLIKADAKREMSKSLARFGIIDSVVYPDLDGLGREIKNRLGFS